MSYRTFQSCRNFFFVCVSDRYVTNLDWLSGCQEISTDSTINILQNNINIGDIYSLNVYTLFVLTFRRIISAPFSGLQSEPSKK
jgi:hypothetical protein